MIFNLLQIGAMKNKAIMIVTRIRSVDTAKEDTDLLQGVARIKGKILEKKSKENLVVGIGSDVEMKVDLPGICNNAELKKSTTRQLIIISSQEIPLLLVEAELKLNLKMQCF